jgi:hypothetical protein
MSSRAFVASREGVPDLTIAEWLPDLTTAEWAQVISAASAAIAAIAAALAVALSLIQQRRTLRPNLTAGVTHGVPSGRLGATFANGGPGVAAQVSYMIVNGDFKKLGLLKDGVLRPGDKEVLDFGHVATRDESGYFIWSCTDAAWNIYIWSSNWESRRFSRKRWLKRDDQSLVGMFRLMYPDVTIPG